ncbi:MULTISPECIES: ZIP family metal transporter [Achromobacter]|uniref:ZIP family metal transporter n=2 Tax=Pseudomonadota TaxID=1224 RepID=A0AA42LN05_9BURK|nr:MULTISPECIES: ZIP family metal transporter [Achromobacter]MDH0734820.1 ZIP family metal transporter [Achromobacter spanius]
MSLIIIITLATSIAGICSVLIADMLVAQVGRAYSQGSYTQQGMLSLAAGALLSTSFTHLLPEALESHVDAHELLLTLLIGVVFFFLLSKGELWHHGHEHSHVNHSHKGRGWSLLTGDGVHCFGDGVLIASIFVADVRLGAIAAISVLVHEIPHHMGDLVVLRQTNRRSAALLKLSFSGAMTALGGVTGYLLLGSLLHWQPYLMALASSSFIYVALADLIPQLQQRRTPKDATVQVIGLVIGLVLVASVNMLSHNAHNH